MIDDGEPPQPDQRDVPVGKMLAALAIEGAVFRVVKGLADNGTRRGVANLTGRWPGEDPAAEDHIRREPLPPLTFLTQRAKGPASQVFGGPGRASSGVRATARARIRNWSERGKRRPGGGGTWWRSASSSRLITSPQAAA